MVRFTRGLHEIGDGIFCYLQPDGSWGWSNAGLIADHEANLLVDTLSDARLTQEMLVAMRDAVPSAARIRTLVNTHGNGDHCYGNGLCDCAEIIASEAALADMRHEPPDMLAGWLDKAESMGDVGAYIRKRFSAFDYRNVSLREPTRTFRGRLDLQVGSKPVELIEVGPAHTRGDVIANLPDHGVVFTGDILFVDCTPIIWAGPAENIIAACDTILATKAHHVVPGHGPVTDAEGVRRVRDYWEFVSSETRRRYDAGMSAVDAARDIELGAYCEWLDWERIVVNVHTLYRNYIGDNGPPDYLELMRQMDRMERGVI